MVVALSQPTSGCPINIGVGRRVPLWSEVWLNVPTGFSLPMTEKQRGR